MSRIAATVSVALPAVALALMCHPAEAAAPHGNPWDGVIDAAARRLLTADPVAVAKWHSHQPIDDPAREQQVLAAVEAQATPLGLDPDYVHRVFRDQLDATKDVERARIAAWTGDPASAPAAGTGLAAIRGQIDSLDRIMVEGLAENTAAAHSPVCRAEVVAAVTGAAVRHRLDPVTARALFDATRDYCAEGDTPR